MKPLKENYKIFVLLGICPPDKPISRRMSIFHILFSVFCTINLFVGLIGSTVFCLKNFSSDLGNGIFGIGQMFATGTCLHALITAHIKRHEIKKIFDDFQTFVDASKFQLQ